MRIVDSHHHLWDLSGSRYPWLAEPMHDRGWGDWSPLRQDYLVSDFLGDASGQDIVASVHVQANFDPSDPVGETAWLDSVADSEKSGGFPQAVVAYADLSRPDAADILAGHAVYSRVRGIRQVLNRHPDPKLNRAPRDFLADPAWQENFSLLGRHGLSFDAQVYHHQMAALAELAASHPATPIILDHCGMPAERDPANIAGWREGMAQLAGCPNVTVKLSGFGMMDLDWTVDSIRPFVRFAIDTFGAGRCMFGSNFPVDRLMKSYDDLWDAYRATVADLRATDREALFSGTAMRVYRLGPVD